MAHRKPQPNPRSRLGSTVGILGIAALVGSIIFAHVTGGSPPRAGPSNPTPAGGLAELLLAYANQHPPQGLPSGVVDISSKDTCDRIKKMTNLSPGDREKVELYVLMQSVQKLETGGLIPRQSLTDRLAQVRAIVAAAEKVYCPGVLPS